MSVLWDMQKLRNERKQRILNILKEKGAMTTWMVAKEAMIAWGTANQLLLELQADGKVKSKKVVDGLKRKIVWEVVENASN